MKVKSKRKAVLPTESVIKPPASVYQLRVEDISLSAGKHKNVHFKRLRYFGCPVLKRGTNNFPDGTLLRNMNRDQFIREMYCLLAPNFDATRSITFSVILKYLAWLDSKGHAISDGEYFNENLIKGKRAIKPTYQY